MIPAGFGFGGFPMARTALLAATLLATFCRFASAADSPTSPWFTRLGRNS
jgi:hypothetical protein